MRCLRGFLSMNWMYTLPVYRSLFTLRKPRSMKSGVFLEWTDYSDAGHEVQPGVVLCCIGWRTNGRTTSIQRRVWRLTLPTTYTHSCQDRTYDGLGIVVGRHQPRMLWSNISWNTNIEKNSTCFLPYHACILFTSCVTSWGMLMST